MSNNTKEQRTRKHTPGPWIARRGTIGTTQYHIAEMMPSAYPDMPPGFAPADEQDANARLISAAPDLLDACENILGMIYRMPVGHHFPGDVDERCDELHAAIAKAKGNQ